MSERDSEDAGCFILILAVLIAAVLCHVVDQICTAFAPPPAVKAEK
jgi:hypothetical protein